MELKLQEMLKVFETQMQAIEGGVQGGMQGAPSGDLMWKSATRAESSVQALCAVCKFAVCSVQSYSVQCAKLQCAVCKVTVCSVQ